MGTRNWSTGCHFTSLTLSRFRVTQISRVFQALAQTVPDLNGSHFGRIGGLGRKMPQILGVSAVRKRVNGVEWHPG